MLLNSACLFLQEPSLPFFFLPDNARSFSAVKSIDEKSEFPLAVTCTSGVGEGGCSSFTTSTSAAGSATGSGEAGSDVGEETGASEREVTTISLRFEFYYKKKH